MIITWALGHLLTLKMPEDYHPEWKTWSMETLPMIPKSRDKTTTKNTWTVAKYFKIIETLGY